MKIILITAYHGDEVSLINAASSILPQLSSDDLWLVVLDNITLDLPFEVDSKVKVLRYQGVRGAGNARNYGLEYLKNMPISYPYCLWPIDGDDKLKNEAVDCVKKIMAHSKESFLTFSHEIVTPVTRRIALTPKGVFSLVDQLYDYRTPCGSTIVKVTNPTFFENVKFGSRRRANDQLFFLSALRFYSRGVYHSEIVLEYNVGFKNTLSSNKLKMPYYKYLALRDFGLNFRATTYYFIIYIFRNIVKRIK